MRWPLATLGVVVSLVLAILVCEAIGWPFLVSPVQKWLASTLDRRVAFNDEAGGRSGVKLHLFGGIKVAAERIEIGAPSWSSEPHMLLARDAELKLGYFALWRAWRGEPLHVARLEAEELDGTLERRADGTASWQFGEKRVADPSEKPLALPTFGSLRVGAGHLAYRDELLPASVDTYFALRDASDRGSAAQFASAASGASSSASDAGIFVRAGGAAQGASAAASSVALAPGESGLRLAATGQYRKLPLRIDLRTAGVLGFLAEGKEAEAQPLRLLASIGKADLSFDGSTTDPLHFAALKGRFTLNGASLAAAGDPLGITLPTTPAFKTRGMIAKDGGVWNANFDDATIGSSRLNGAFTYDTRRKVPLLSGKLGGSRLLLADLGPAVGTPAAGQAPAAKNASGERVIPDKKFDLPSLRAMDANVLIEIAMFDSGTTLIEPLRPVRGHLLLADGVLTIADFDGRTAQGRLVGFLQLDGRGKQALWTADMRALGIDLSHWLRLKRADGAPPYISGKLDALVKVKGSGRSSAEILGSLGGDIRIHLRDATLSHLVVEAGGIDLAQALGLVFKGDDSLPILCNVVDLDVVNGVATPKVFVLNTRDSTIWVDGTVSLKTEAMDLRAVVSPKDFSPLTLRTPIRVKGTLGDPAVTIEAGKLLGKAGAAGLLAVLLNPLAAIIPFIDPGAREAAKEAAAQCARLVPTSGKIAAPTKVPARLPVPAPPAPRASAAPAR
ncbi:MAG: AsmA family protein [Caldimonas sp.]